MYAVQNPPTVDGISPVNVAAHVTLTHEGGAISHLPCDLGSDRYAVQDRLLDRRLRAAC